MYKKNQEPGIKSQESRVRRRFFRFCGIRKI